MGKILAIGEALIVFKELWDSTSEFFSKSVPNDFYKMMDKAAFLTSEFLGIDSYGNFSDKTEKIAEAIMNLSCLVIWGVLLFFGFKSLFAYFLSKKTDIPWKFFIRMIIFGVLANASFFICYTGVFLTENCTEYIRSYVGADNVSFSFLEKYEKSDIDDEEEVDVYVTDALISVFIYFSTFFTAVCLAGRYILIKVLILLSPVFFVLGGLRCGEKIFFGWCRSFFSLLFMQVLLCVALGIFSFSGMRSELFSQILCCAILLVFCRNIFGFLKLSY